MKLFNKYYPFAFISLSALLLLIASFYEFKTLESSININLLRVCLSFIAGLSGVICVFLVAIEKISSYYFAILSSLCWVFYLLLWSPLLWDIAINICYLILSFYGLYYWKNPSKNQKSTKQDIALTRNLTKNEYILYAILFLVAVFVLSTIGISTEKYSSKAQAITDASTTVIAILGQWLMSKKIFQNWHCWIALNTISIPLYISIGSIVLTMTWVLYLINSIYGFYIWKQNMLKLQADS